MCISPPSAWITSPLTGRAAASISTGNAAISIGVARPARSNGATEAGSSNRQASALSSSRARPARPASVLRSSTSERLEVLRNWKSALPPCGRNGGALRTGSPPGGSILSTSAPRSAAILAASDVAKRRQSGTFASFTSTMVKRASGRGAASVIAR